MISRMVDTFCSFLPMFRHLFTRLRQKKAHICLSDECVLFSTKSIYLDEIAVRTQPLQNANKTNILAVSRNAHRFVVIIFRRGNHWS